MGEIIPFPSRDPAKSPQITAGQRGAPATVFHDRGWRILEMPRTGQFLAVSAYCRRGVEVGRFDPREEPGNHHGGSEIAILTRCGTDERLSRCAIGWLNAGGPPTAILGAFVIAAGGRYRYWRDAIIEVAAIGGARLVRLLDGSIAIARDPEPVPLLDIFAALRENRRRAAFDRLPRECGPRFYAGPTLEISSASRSRWGRLGGGRECARRNPALLRPPAGRKGAPHPCQPPPRRPY